MALPSGSTDYCNNCGHHSVLVDGVWCSFCKTFWQRWGRFPAKGDTL